MTETWVFGYGSLCWNPGFKFLDSLTGCVTGYSRRFWQGNTTHRGTTAKPGRVATLIEEKNGVVWGRAFLVADSSALPYLDTREVRLGGYTTAEVTFHPRAAALPPLPALLYLATPENDLWLGEAPEQEIAHQILTCCGPSGHNVEYLLRLVEFMREEVPEAEDEHLYRLEELVLAGGGEPGAAPVGRGRPEPQRLRDLPQFADRVQTNKLRCLGI